MRKRASVSDVLATGVGATPPTSLRATPEGTARYAARHAAQFEPDFFRAGPSSIVVSSLGFGTYLGECDEADDEHYAGTVARALASGVNLIDTAINYRCQRSERAVGAALQRALASGDVEREAVVVCTKGGYVPLADTPPPSREHYRAYLQREFFDTGVMTPDDIIGGGHSMAPSFLRYAITRSRRNLGVRTIDVYYLHNPEQQIGHVSAHSFRERVRAAFMVLEDAVSRGEIGVYGCATWNALRVPPDVKGHLALRDLVQIARDVAGDAHHFRVVQMPISLAMPEAVRQATQPMGADDALVPALSAAESFGLTVVASASLMQARLTRGLPPSIQELFPSQRTDAQRALSFVRSLPGVTTALVGTRSEAHLAENLESARRS